VRAEVRNVQRRGLIGVARHAVYACMRLITRMIAIMLGVGALLTLAWTGALVWVFYLLAMSSLS
jgi:hypothetical protein